VTTYRSSRMAGVLPSSVQSPSSDGLSRNCKSQLPALVGQEICACPSTVAIFRRTKRGSSTKTLNVGPVGGGASSGPLGAATVNPVIGNANICPLKTHVAKDGQKKSCALSTSYAASVT